MLDRFIDSQICTFADPMTGELVTGTAEDIAGFMEFADGMEAYEADVLAGDDDARHQLASRAVWSATPPASLRRARDWRGASRATALIKAITTTARVAAAALAAIITALAMFVADLAVAAVSAAAKPLTNPVGRLHRLPHAALTPRLAARPRGGRVLITAV